MVRPDLSFERGGDPVLQRYGKRFHDEGNKVFRVTSEDDLDLDTILYFIDQFQRRQLPRLKHLLAYYLNETNINHRDARDETRADNRLSHNYARYISTLIQGYLVGKPIVYNHDNEELLSQINDFNDFNDEQSHNSLLELNLSIYGRGFELVYVDEYSQEKIAMLQPTECFVVYDATVEMQPIAAVRFYEIEVADRVTKYIEYYTAEKIYRYQSDGEFDDVRLVGEESHYLDGVPIVEYWNNDYRIGDFEQVLDQIDAYDKSQSDTANEQEDFADAYLVLQGQPNTNDEDITDMKKARVIVLDEGVPNGQAPSAYYLVKQYDVAGVEAYKNRLNDDIHKLSFVPDMSDENFSGNSSGEALKYKLFLLDQLRATKERLYKRGVMQRFRLVASIWGIKQRNNSDIENLEIIFTPNLPANVKESVDVASAVEGIVSKETQLSILPMVEDVGAEQERIQAEEEALQNRNPQYNGVGQNQNANDQNQDVTNNGGNSE